MGRLSAAEYTARNLCRDDYGPEFELIPVKKKQLLPKSAPHVTAAVTEETDRQLREQIRRGIALCDIEVTRIIHIPATQPSVSNKNKKKKA